jgi:hypothetical protein
MVGQHGGGATHRSFKTSKMLQFYIFGMGMTCNELMCKSLLSGLPHHHLHRSLSKT